MDFRRRRNKTRLPPTASIFLCANKPLKYPHHCSGADLWSRKQLLLWIQMMERCTEHDMNSHFGLKTEFVCCLKSEKCAASRQGPSIRPGFFPPKPTATLTNEELLKILHTACDQSKHQAGLRKRQHAHRRQWKQQQVANEPETTS